MKILTLLVIVLVAIFAQQVSASLGWANCSRSFLNGFTPGQPRDASQVCRDGVLAISYSGQRRNPNYAAYYITPQNVADNIAGRDDFYEDPDLKAAGINQASVDSDVFSTELNRGHLAPSRIMSFSLDAKLSCYTMANIAPQAGYFNQHPWQYLETDVFEWIGGNQALYIVTGVAYDDIDHPETIAGVAVPTYFWKALCDPVKNQSTAFFGYNKDDQIKKHIKEHGIASGAMENFITVKDLQERIYKQGEIFPASKCNTGKVDEDFWGWSTSSYGLVDKEFGTVSDILANKNLEPKKAFKALYQKHRAEYQKEKLKAKQQKQRQQ